MDKQYFTYINANKSGSTLYVGTTNNLSRRSYEHKKKFIKGFTARYNVDNLIYYEVFDSPQEAIAREKEIKGWIRKKKMELIKKVNPSFKDLSKDLE